MQQRSSIAITAAEPIAVPAPTSESKSSVTRLASSAVRITVDEPPGITAFSVRPSAMPPPRSLIRSLEREPVRQLVVAAVDDVAREREDARARRALDAELRVLGAADLEHRRRGRDRLDVVDGRRRGVEAGDRRERRLRARLAAPALERLEQRRLLAADVGAGAAVEDDRDVAEQLLRRASARARRRAPRTRPRTRRGCR